MSDDSRAAEGGAVPGVAPSYAHPASPSTLRRIESQYRRSRTLALVAHPAAHPARERLHAEIAATFGTDRAGCVATARFYARCGRAFPDWLLLWAFRVLRRAGLR